MNLIKKLFCREPLAVGQKYYSDDLPSVVVKILAVKYGVVKYAFCCEHHSHSEDYWFTMSERGFRSFYRHRSK